MKKRDKSILPTCPDCLWELERCRYLWFNVPYPSIHDDPVAFRSYHDPKSEGKEVKGAYCARHSILSNCSGRSGE